jgi:hypothetical protein
VAGAQGKSQDVSSCGFCQVLSLGFAEGKSKLSAGPDGGVAAKEQTPDVSTVNCQLSIVN